MIEVDVLVIGAGFGGLGMGSRLGQAGYSYVILESASEIGGVWRPGSYPGSRCDVPAPLYSFSYFIDATPGYPLADHTYTYTKKLASHYDIWPHLKLNHRVTSLIYNDITGKWTVTATSTENNHDVTFTAQFVIPAVGQLQHAKLPNISGHTIFRGASWHVSGWRHDVDLKGKTVAVIGTGPSAAQIIPELAKTAAHVIVYQRTAPWVLPRAADHPSRFTKWIFRRSPNLAAKLYRWVIYFSADLLLTPLSRKYGWSVIPLSLASKLQLRRQIPDPNLRAQLTPHHRLGCKRAIVSSTYYSIFNEKNVSLITDHIDEITAAGIRTKNEQELAIDHIIYATGYRTTEFFEKITVRGRHGVSLQELWEHTGIEAYHGIALSEMPNLLCLHGPGSFADNGSNVVVNERQAEIIMKRLAAWWPHRNSTALIVKPQAMTRERARRHKRIRRSSYVTCSSWYRSVDGTVLNPSGASPIRLWWASVSGLEKDFEFIPLSHNNKEVA